MQESRLFQIVYCLLEQGQATAPELAEKLEVSVRTIYRDMDALSAAGIPIYAQAGRNGGISLMKDFVLDKAVLSEDEKQEILTALQDWVLHKIKTAPGPCKSSPPCFAWMPVTGWKWIFPGGEILVLTMKNLNGSKQP